MTALPSTFARLALLASVVVLCGCNRDFEPPAVSQMSCTPEGTPVGATSLVFVLDTGLKQVTWANGPGAPRGRLTVDNYSYRFSFPATAKVYASEAVVQRYDGRMEREFGTKPLIATVVPKAGNVRQVWHCATVPSKPKV